MYRILLTLLTLSSLFSCTPSSTPEATLPSTPFPGERGLGLDTFALEGSWEKEREGFLANFVKVPRDSVVGFAL